MDSANRTFVSSVLFIDIVEYSKQSVADQHILKQRFNTLLVDALKQVPVSDRIVLDTGDGAAVSFQGNPEDSLFAGMHMRDAIASSTDDTPKLAVRFGINLGPVRLLKDINGQLNIIGDGINVAQRVMSFAEPGCILVSRSYYEVVSRVSDDYAKFFSEAGTRTDKHVREHAVYEIGQSNDGIRDGYANATKPSADTLAANENQEAAGNQEMAVPGTTRSRKWMLGGGAVLAGFLLLAAINGSRDNKPAPDSATAPAERATNNILKEPPKETKKTEPPLPLAKVTPPKPIPVKEEAPKPMITVILSVKPWGEVYVDGKKKGVSPPLKSINLTPGSHVIEIQNTTFPKFVKSLTVKPGDKPKIEQKF